MHITDRRLCCQADSTEQVNGLKLFEQFETLTTPRWPVSTKRFVIKRGFGFDFSLTLNIGIVAEYMKHTWQSITKEHQA